MNENFQIYTAGERKKLPDFTLSEALSDPKLYLPSQRLMRVVNVALTLGKPLLLTGEPGTGKTELAHSVALNFGQEGALTFNTRTTSTAADLFYHYHSLQHFHYAQIKDNPVLSNAEIEQRFINYAALGEAIRLADPNVTKASELRRSVVLIDEIDKAPRDLPNDILNVMEKPTFFVPEIDKTFRADDAYQPVIVLTSNSEKNLPDAFLRRCVYFHIEFPDDEALLAILSRRATGEIYTEAVIKEKVLPHFRKIRNTVQRKKPATSELIYWVSLLERLEFPPEHLENVAELDKATYETLLTSYTILVKTQEDLKLLKRR